MPQTSKTQQNKKQEALCSTSSPAHPPPAKAPTSNNTPNPATSA
nr:MAG TPA: hypothetical protein [Bacteriophage sp.]